MTIMNSQDSTTPPLLKKKKNRKGRLAKLRDAEKYRFKKNLKFDEKLSYLNDLNSFGFLDVPVSQLLFDKNFQQHIEINLSMFETDLHNDNHIYVPSSDCNLDADLFQYLENIDDDDDEVTFFDLIPYCLSGFDERIYEFIVPSLLLDHLKIIEECLYSFGEPSYVVYIPPGFPCDVAQLGIKPSVLSDSDGFVFGGSVFVTSDFKLLSYFQCPILAYFPPRPVWNLRNQYPYDYVKQQLSGLPQLFFFHSFQPISDYLRFRSQPVNDYYICRLFRFLERVKTWDDRYLGIYSLLCEFRELSPHERYSLMSGGQPRVVNVTRDARYVISDIQVIDCMFSDQRIYKSSIRDGKLIYKVGLEPLNYELVKLKNPRLFDLCFP